MSVKTKYTCCKCRKTSTNMRNRDGKRWMQVCEQKSFNAADSHIYCQDCIPFKYIKFYNRSENAYF